MTLALRQKKCFETRISLARVFIEKLKKQKFEDISIKDICFETSISEATFFNYFPQKIDVIAYLIKAKLNKIFWTVNNLREQFSFIQLIEKTFELFALEIKHAYIFYEVIEIFNKNNIEINSVNISSEELQYIFPECENIEKTSYVSLNDFFEDLINYAIEKKQISNKICKKTILQFLITLLKGVPLSITISEFKNIAQIYQKHLSLLWKIFKL